MSEHGPAFDRAQRQRDNSEHPDYYLDESDWTCDICIFYPRGHCVAQGETKPGEDCPSFKD